MINNKLLIFAAISLVMGNASVYAFGEATYDPNTQRLILPDVKVPSGDPSKPLRYEVEMEMENNPDKMSFTVVKVSERGIEGPFLRRIRERGSLLCGKRTDSLAGFSYDCSDGSPCGFDIELCRAVAAAVLDSSEGPIQPITVSSEQRAIKLQQADVDMLSRNTSWTSSRDARWGHFTWIMFYDGQGFMVRRDSGITTLAELNGKNICVVPGTTSHHHLKDAFARRGLQFTLVSGSEISEIISLYLEGKCDAVTSDKSGLAAKRAGFFDRDNHDILDITISKEPLTPIVPSGDEQWLDIVKMVMFGLINAEELGITQANVDSMMNNENPEVRRLLGVEKDSSEQAISDFGQETLGLKKGAIAQAIRAVGNYGEIYERHLGENGVKIPRGLNKLWREEGGLIYAPPMR